MYFWPPFTCSDIWNVLSCAKLQDRRQISVKKKMKIKINEPLKTFQVSITHHHCLYLQKALETKYSSKLKWVSFQIQKQLSQENFTVTEKLVIRIHTLQAISKKKNYNFYLTDSHSDSHSLQCQKVVCLFIIVTYSEK